MTTPDREALAAWKAELATRARPTLAELLASKEAERDAARAAIVPRGPAWVTQALEHEARTRLDGETK